METNQAGWMRAGVLSKAARAEAVFVGWAGVAKLRLARDHSVDARNAASSCV
jgi:hypothetical protein